MSLSSSIFYVVGAALVVLALLLAWSRRGHSVRTRDFTGNMVVGDVSGWVSQNSVQPLATPPPAADAKSRSDRVAWIIGIVGVLVALAQLGRDVLAGK